MLHLTKRLSVFLALGVLAACGGGGGGSEPDAPSYTIGGAVTGLSGTGLVLQNNAADDTPIAASGTFRFSAALRSGAPYGVTVKTHPTNQFCSVAGGSGTVGVSNVTNVAVTCNVLQAGTYSVGGTIIGLSGTVVLTNTQTGHGPDELSSDANGAFTFQTLLATAADYAVTVKTKPANQTCEVRNGAGTVAASNVTDVEIRCAAIAAGPFRIGGTIAGLTDTSFGLLLHSPHVDEEELVIVGNGIFVFPNALADGAEYSVTVGRQPNGMNCIVTNAEGVVGGSNVTNVAVNCNALLQLTSSDPIPDRIDVSRNIAPTLTFSAALDPATVTTSNITMRSDAGDAAIVVEVVGNVVTVTPTRRLLPITRYTLKITAEVRGAAGERLGAAQTRSFTTLDGTWGNASNFVTSDTLFESEQPNIVADDLGNVLAVWDQREGTVSRVWANWHTSATYWGTPEPISLSNQEANNSHVAINANGTAMAVWEESDSVQINLVSREYSRANGWGPIEPVDGELGDVQNARVAIDPSGSAAAVWTQISGLQQNVVASTRFAATGWSDPSVLENSDGVPNAPQIAMDGVGNAFAVWQQRLDGRARVVVNQFTVRTAQWGEAGLVELLASGDARDPQLAVDAQGNAFTVWSQVYPTGFDDALVNRFSTINPGVGGAVEILEAATGNANTVRIAVNAAGRALAVWNQDGALRSKRFTADGWVDELPIDVEGDAREISVAMDAAGNAVAVWVETNNDPQQNLRHNIRASRYTSGRGWSTPETLDILDSRASHPQVVTERSGDVMVVWVQFDGARFNIWSRRLG